MVFFVSVFCQEVSATLKAEKIQWDNLDVTFVEDNKLPLYSVRFYFADGASSDSRSKSGETKMTFDLLKSGTRSFNQREINDNLEQ